MEFFENFKIKLKEDKQGLVDKLGFINILKSDGTWKFKTSYENWRTHDKTNTVLELTNEPITGFVVNKYMQRFGRYSNSLPKVRVLDPRGFEIEIRLDNFFELINYGIDSGGVINTEMVYAYSNNSLTLVPTNSKIYKERGGKNTVETEIENLKLLGFDNYKKTKGCEKYFYHAKSLKSKELDLVMRPYLRFDINESTYMVNTVITEHNTNRSTNLSFKNLLVKDDIDNALKDAYVRRFLNENKDIEIIKTIDKLEPINFTNSQTLGILSGITHLLFKNKVGTSYLLSLSDYRINNRRYTPNSIQYLSSTIDFMYRVDIVDEKYFVVKETFCSSHGKTVEICSKILNSKLLQPVKIKPIRITKEENQTLKEKLIQTYYN